jgi:hypothetical protein
MLRVDESVKQETILKAGGEQSNQLADIPDYMGTDYMGSRREMEDSNSVLAGLPIGQN